MLPLVQVSHVLASSSSDTEVVVFPLDVAETGLVLSLIFLLATAVLPLLRRSGLPPHGPQSLDVPLDVPPAIAAFLVHPEEVPGEAGSATLVDLAARGALEVVDLGGLRCALRVTGRVPDGLTVYENRVLALVRAHAGADGLVPGEALSAGQDADRATAWMNGFNREVLAAARAQGLVQRRYGREVGVLLTSLLGTAAVVGGWGFAGAARYTRGTPHPAVPDEALRTGLSYAATATAGLALFLLLGLLVSSAQKLTDSGRTVASRMLGLADHLAADEQLAQAPPGAVAVWGRLLAFATGFGVARAAQRALPLGPESDTRAWTDSSGTWRLVRVSYEGGAFDSWGQAPLTLIGRGLKALFPLVLPAVVVVTLGDALRQLLEQVHLGALVLAVVGVVGAGIVLTALRGASLLLLGVASLFAPRREVAGTALRVRPAYANDDARSGWWVALDDGVSAQVRAFRAVGAARIRQGGQVRLKVRGLTGQVMTVEASGGRDLPTVPADAPFDLPLQRESPLAAWLGRKIVARYGPGAGAAVAGADEAPPPTAGG